MPTPPLETKGISIFAEPSTNPSNIKTKGVAANKGHKTQPIAVKKPLPKRCPKSNKSIHNLSSWMLTEAENSVLELGLDISSVKAYDKISTVTEFFYFIWRLRREGGSGVKI